MATGLPESDAAAAIWTLGHRLMHRFLVVDEAWPEERYRAWLVAGLGRILAAPPGLRRSSAEALLRCDGGENLQTIETHCGDAA